MPLFSGAVMNLLIRLAMFSAVLAPWPALALAHEPSASPTPPESCLTLETFPVGPGEHPHDVAPAADGIGVWYTAQHAGALGLLDPRTGAIETIPLGPGSFPHGVVVGPDGAAWVTDTGQNAIIRVAPDSRELAIWPLAGENANLNTATIGRGGIIWFTGQNGSVGRLDPATTPAGTAIETVVAPRGRGPYGIDATPEGDVYFASLAGNYLGQIVGDGPDFSLAVIPPPTPGQGTRRVWSDAQGVLWTSQWNAGQVARYDPDSGEWREWRLPGNAPQAYAVYVDERDDVWLSDFSANALVRFDPDTEAFATMPLPWPGAAVRQLLGRPGEIWGAASGADALVVVRATC